MKGPQVRESEKLTKEILRETDVLYVTRIQKERFTDLDQYNVSAYRIFSITTLMVLIDFVFNIRRR